MTADYFRTLAAYNRWANLKVLDAAAAVSQESYLETVPGLSFGSLHGTLVHCLVAEVIWAARFRGVPPAADLSDPRGSTIVRERLPDLASVRRQFDLEWETQQELFAGLSDAVVVAPLSYSTQDGQPWVQPLDQIMGHMFNHSTQFRSEASVRLTELGQSPGDLDLLIFMRERARPQ